MGCDGGFFAFKAQDVIDVWTKLTPKLIKLIHKNYKQELEWHEKSKEWTQRDGEKLAKERGLPYPKPTKPKTDYLIPIPKNSDELAARLRTVATSCDTPTSLGDYLILAYGDNISDEADELKEIILNACYKKEYRRIETWT